MEIRDRIAEILCDADEWGLSFDDIRANEHFAPDVKRYYMRADAILALEVEGKTACTYKSDCNFRKKGICYKADMRRHSPGCKDQRPATIKDLTGG